MTHRLTYCLHYMKKCDTVRVLPVPDYYSIVLHWSGVLSISMYYFTFRKQNFWETKGIRTNPENKWGCCFSDSILGSRSHSFSTALISSSKLTSNTLSLHPLLWQTSKRAERERCPCLLPHSSVCQTCRCSCLDIPQICPWRRPRRSRMSSSSQTERGTSSWSACFHIPGGSWGFLLV